MDAFKVVRDFEQALCDYTGAKYAVTTTSCTMALLLAVKWHIHNNFLIVPASIKIPKRTYVGVPMSIIHAGRRPEFTDYEWNGLYRLAPLPVWDSARWFTSQMYEGTTKMPEGDMQTVTFAGEMVCVSFHWSKTLGIQQGGAILHDNPQADEWLRRARFDGRKEGLRPKEDKAMIVGYHAYMSPETAAAGLVRLSNLPRHNAPLPWGLGTNSDYPDLSELECFK